MEIVVLVTLLFWILFSILHLLFLYRASKYADENNLKKSLKSFRLMNIFEKLTSFFWWVTLIGAGGIFLKYFIKIFVLR